MAELEIASDTLIVHIRGFDQFFAGVYAPMSRAKSRWVELNWWLPARRR